MRDQTHGMTMVEVSRLIAARWKAMGPAEKQPYEEMARDDRDRSVLTNGWMVLCESFGDIFVFLDFLSKCMSTSCAKDSQKSDKVKVWMYGWMDWRLSSSVFTFLCALTACFDSSCIFVFFIIRVVFAQLPYLICP
jgi:hypothetical protein